MKQTFTIFQALLLLFALFFINACQETEITQIGIEAEDPVLHNNAQNPEQTLYLTYNHGGLTRSYIFFIPANLPANAPLVFVLHGATQYNTWAYNDTGMKEKARIEKFAVCFPQGTVSPLSNLTHWNSNLEHSVVDDLGFLNNLAQDLHLTYNLNPQKTFICGLSNGGFMSYLMACEYKPVFKGMACVAGTMSGHTWNHCAASKAVPVLHIHGTSDAVVPINGTMTTASGWGGAPHVDSVVLHWANHNHCASVDTTFYPPHTTGYFHRGGINSSEVWYYKINTMGHRWPLQADGYGIHSADVIWDFFDQI